MSSDQTDKIKYFDSLRPVDFPILVRLTTFQEISLILDPPILNVEVVLSKESNKDQQQLFINFKQVTNFKFIQPNTSLVIFSQIEITSIRTWQWENKNYKVTESEEGFFSLICKDFDAIIR